MLVPDLVLCQPCMLLPSLLLLHHDLENVLGLGYRGWVTWRRAKSLWCSSQGHLRSAKSPLVPTALPTFPSKSAPHTLPTSGLPTFPSRHLRAKSTSHPSVDMSCSTWDHCSMCFINACCIWFSPFPAKHGWKRKGVSSWEQLQVWMERTARSGIGKKMWIGGFSDTDSSQPLYISKD